MNNTGMVARLVLPTVIAAAVIGGATVPASAEPTPTPHSPQDAPRALTDPLAQIPAVKGLIGGVTDTGGVLGDPIVGGVLGDPTVGGVLGGLTGGGKGGLLGSGLLRDVTGSEKPRPR
jgi:hypothetical protein